MEYVHRKLSSTSVISGHTKLHQQAGWGELKRGGEGGMYSNGENRERGEIVADRDRGWVVRKKRILDV